MLTGFNISPLPFYNSLSEQFAKQPCAFGVNYPLLCGLNEPLPFLFHTNVSSDSTRLQSIAIVREGGLVQFDVTAHYQGHGFYMDGDGVAGGGTFVGFFPSSDFNYQFPSVGNYYYVITLIDTDLGVDTYTYYSELFCVTDMLNDAIKITYTNPTNIETPFGEIPFNDEYNPRDPYAFSIWVNALIGKPEYNFEETETNRNGYSFLERVVSKKTYKFAFVAPEYLCDALRLAKLCSEMTITHRGKTYLPTTFDISVKWEEQGDLASVTITFDTDNILYTIGGYTRDLLLVP